MTEIVWHPIGKGRTAHAFLLDDLGRAACGRGPGRSYRVVTGEWIKRKCHKCLNRLWVFRP